MPPGLPRLLAVATITIGLMMSVLSNSMTNLALPYIAKDLAITAESSIWIVNAYQIALMVSLLPVAALADIVGYRHVYRFGLAAFCIASLGCVLAPSLAWLVTARVVQGLAGSAIMAIQPALVRAIYPRNMLGRGLGFNTTVVATSLAAGPSIGALLLNIVAAWKQEPRGAPRRAWRLESKPHRRTKAFGKALAHFLHSASTWSASSWSTVVAPRMARTRSLTW